MNSLTVIVPLVPLIAVALFGAFRQFRLAIRLQRAESELEIADAEIRVLRRRLERYENENRPADEG